MDNFHLILIAIKVFFVKSQLNYANPNDKESADSFKPTISKCCDLAQTLVITNESFLDCGMVPGIPDFKATNLQIYDIEKKLNVSKISDVFNIENKLLKCENYLPDENIMMQKNGSVIVRSKTLTVVPSSDYCIDNFHDVIDGKSIYTLNAIFCQREEEENEDYSMALISGGISLLFMLPTLVVYAMIPELRNYKGRIQMLYIGTLFFGLFFLFTMQLAIVLQKANVQFCAIMSLLVYYFLLAAFFWMNVMSFDMWNTFIKTRPSQVKRLKVYALYAFGMPLLLTLLFAYMQHGPIPRDWLRPIDNGRCFFKSDSMRKFYYFYLPMLIICAFNTFFFIQTTCALLKAKKEKRIQAENVDSRLPSKDIAGFEVYAKLFIVMGISWVFEVISMFWLEFKGWLITDVINMLVGLNIFVLMICTKRTWGLIKKRFVQIKGSGRTSSQSSSSNRTKHTSVKSQNNISQPQGVVNTAAEC